MTGVRSTANSREQTILPSPIDYVQRSPVPAVESFQKPRSSLPESRTDRMGCVPLDWTTGTRDHLLLPATRSSSDHPSLVTVHSRFGATILLAKRNCRQDESGATERPGIDDSTLVSEGHSIAERYVLMGYVSGLSLLGRPSSVVP
jgi:hypothetical protein